VAARGTPQRRARVDFATLTIGSRNQIVDILLEEGEDLLVHSTEFGYGPAGERLWRRDQAGSTTTEPSALTHYLAGVEVIRPAGGMATFKRYLGGIAISEITGASVTRRYLFVDHLGSTDAITNESGVVVDTQHFGPWGNRRGNDWQSADTSAHPITRKGFTGHEMADGVGLIHMNGRMYDAETGRFIQADPNIDEGLQGLNRYSYVLNNPLSSTDPTGYFSAKDFLRTALAIAITVYTGGSAGGAAWGLFGQSVTLSQAIAITAIGGFASGAVQTGSLKGAVNGAFSSLLFFGIGGSYGSGGLLTRTIANGIGGGIVAELQGGKFGHGFVSAGIGSLAGDFAGRIDGQVGFSIKRTVVAAIAGGTASTVTGGKFASGALSSAMSQAFGDWARGYPGKAQSDTKSTPSMSPKSLRLGDWRRFNSDEIEKILRPIFRDSIDYSDIKVFNEVFKRNQEPGTAYAFMNRIYFHPKDYTDNFATADASMVGLLVHEVTHIWQWQNNELGLLKKGINNKTYAYEMAAAGPARAFSHYGREQQAEITRGYYLAANGYVAPASAEQFRSILPYRWSWQQ
jgi:RHS repeat-associated protein